ncbi:hypothetical protein F1B92_06310, partial [Campylobacter sp. FMV-PI01]
MSIYSKRLKFLSLALIAAFGCNSMLLAGMPKEGNFLGETQKEQLEKVLQEFQEEAEKGLQAISNNLEKYYHKSKDFKELLKEIGSEVEGDFPRLKDAYINNDIETISKDIVVIEEKIQELVKNDNNESIKGFREKLQEIQDLEKNLIEKQEELTQGYEQIKQHGNKKESIQKLIQEQEKKFSKLLEELKEYDPYILDDGEDNKTIKNPSQTHPNISDGTDNSNNPGASNQDSQLAPGGFVSNQNSELKKVLEEFEDQAEDRLNEVIKDLEIYSKTFENFKELSNLLSSNQNSQDTNLDGIIQKFKDEIEKTENKIQELSKYNEFQILAQEIQALNEEIQSLEELIQKQQEVLIKKYDEAKNNGKDQEKIKKIIQKQEEEFEEFEERLIADDPDKISEIDSSLNSIPPKNRVTKNVFKEFIEGTKIKIDELKKQLQEYKITSSKSPNNEEVKEKIKEFQEKILEFEKEYKEKLEKVEEEINLDQTRKNLSAKIEKQTQEIKQKTEELTQEIKKIEEREKLQSDSSNPDNQKDNNSNTSGGENNGKDSTPDQPNKKEGMQNDAPQAGKKDENGKGGGLNNTPNTKQE